MDQRDRLIELIDGFVFGTQIAVNSIEWNSNKVKELADHLIGNGVTCLPCNVGDTVYTIPRTAIRKWTVVFIGICGDGRHYMNIAWYRDEHHFETRSVYWEDIGKTVFLSREDAEKALKGKAEYPEIMKHFMEVE